MRTTLRSEWREIRIDRTLHGNVFCFILRLSSASTALYGLSLSTRPYDCVVDILKYCLIS